ncbi:MAG TPA: hypothetical protein VGS22_19440 [Thermoanaerobaculia bacterium]|nr:hypothetical protein [Thermoanaerobaculia bacterium]
MQNPVASFRRLAGRPLAFLVFVGAASIAAPALAQFDEYRPPGGLIEPPADRKGALETASESARWHLGPIRLAPWWELRDIQYVDNAFGVSDGKTGDVTASVGAGLRAYFRTGPKVYWRLQALPEYIWWREAAERRRLGGRYGLSAYAFWNHLTLEANGERIQEQKFLSPEVSALGQSRSDRGALAIDLAITDRISLFAGAEDIAIRNLVSRSAGEIPFDQFDRDESFLRGGARYRLPRGFSIGVGVERAVVDFVDAPEREDRSSIGTSPFIQFRQQNEDRFFDLEVAARSADPRPGSSFVPFNSTTAKLAAGFGTGNRLSTSAYGSRGIVYTLASGYSYLEDDRLGGALNFEVSRRTSLRMFAEVGRDTYRVAVAGTPERRDDLFAYGVALNLTTGRSSSFGIHLSRIDLTSDLPGLDRSVTAVGAGLTLRGGDGG